MNLPIAEAVVRGHKSGLFTSADYNNLCQCETLEDNKLHLVRCNASSEILLAGVLVSTQ